MKYDSFSLKDTTLRVNVILARQVSDFVIQQLCRDASPRLTLLPLATPQPPPVAPLLDDPNQGRNWCLVPPLDATSHLLPPLLLDNLYPPLPRHSRPSPCPTWGRHRASSQPEQTDIQCLRHCGDICAHRHHRRRAVHVADVHVPPTTRRHPEIARTYREVRFAEQGPHRGDEGYFEKR